MAVRAAEPGRLLVWHLTHAIRQAEIQAELFEVVGSKECEEKLDHLFEDCEARLRELEDHLCRWQMRDPDSSEPCEQMSKYELKVDNLLETIGNVKLAVYKAREIEKVEKVEKDVEKDEKDEKVDMVDASTSDHKCNICGKECHTEKDCTFPQNVGCFRCGEKGHMSQSPLCQGEPPKQAARCTGKKHKNRPGWTRCKCKYCCKSGPCTDAQKTQEEKKVKFEDDEVDTARSSGPEVSGATKPLVRTSDDVVLLDAEPKPTSIMKSDATTGEVSIQVTDSVTGPPVKKAEPACSVTIQSHVRYHKQGGTTNKNCGTPSAGDRFVISLETWNELVSSNAFRRVEDSVITDRCDCTGPPPPRYMTPPIPGQRTGTLSKEDAGDIDSKCQEDKKSG